MKPPTRIGANQVLRAAQGCGLLHFVRGWPAWRRRFPPNVLPYMDVRNALAGASK
jgi:hypothetical protein